MIREKLTKMQDQAVLVELIYGAFVAFGYDLPEEAPEISKLEDMTNELVNYVEGLEKQVAELTAKLGDSNDNPING